MLKLAICLDILAAGKDDSFHEECNILLETTSLSNPSVANTSVSEQSPLAVKLDDISHNVSSLNDIVADTSVECDSSLDGKQLYIIMLLGKLSYVQSVKPCLKANNL